MIQHRVFIANSSSQDISISDSTVQNILKTGDRVAYIKNGVIYYANNADQAQWFTVVSESTRTVDARDQNIFNANDVYNEKGLTVDAAGNQYTYFHIDKELTTDINGNEWYVFTISDMGLKHENLTTCHFPYDVKAYHYILADGDDISTISMEKIKFENVLAMIFKSNIFSVNHNIEGLHKTLSPSNPVRYYSENNIICYGIHTTDLILSNGSVPFDEIPPGQYKFMIAKVIHATNNNINDIQQISISAYNNDKCYFTKILITPNSIQTLTDKYINCESRDISISVERSNNMSEIYLNLTFVEDISENNWICNASVLGSEHSRFAKVLRDKFHTIVGTSYDCFHSDTNIYSYTASNAGTYQERYKTDIMMSRGYPYAIRINIKPNESYPAYVPDFISSEDKSYSLSIDGVEYYRYTYVSDDNLSLIYDSAYEKPEGFLLFTYKDNNNGREYSASYKIQDLSSATYVMKNIGDDTFNVLDIDVTVTRGKANLNSVDGITFVAYTALPNMSNESFPDFNSTEFDLDSYLKNPGASVDRSYNDNSSSLLGLSLKGNNNSNYSGFIDNAVNTYCSGDNRGDKNNKYNISSIPYIQIPSQYKQQSNSIVDNIINRIGDQITLESTYEDVVSVVSQISANRFTITSQEFQSINKSDIYVYKQELAQLIANKALSNWNGEIVTSELYYFDLWSDYWNNPVYIDDEYTFKGGLATVPVIIINNKRDIYNILFSIYRNRKRDDEMNISINDIETETITFKRSHNDNPLVSVKCPVYLNRRFNGNTYKYKLVDQQTVSSRVLAEHQFAFDGKEHNTTLDNVTQGIFSFLYKIEPDTGKTISDYPTDDYLLGETDYPKSIYSPSLQNQGYWLMCNPLLCCDINNYTPIDFLTSDDIEEYHNDSHILKINGVYYYATSHTIKSSNVNSYDDLSSDFIKNATETGLPLFSIVFFDVKAINPLSVNLKQFCAKHIKEYIEAYISEHIGSTITDVPGVTAASGGANYYNIVFSDSSLLNKIQKILIEATNATEISFYYNDDTYEDYIPQHINNSGSKILYGAYNYNSDPSVDDWEFEFVTD